MITQDILSLLNASHELVSQLDLDRAIERIINEATTVVRAESCALILRDEKFDECYFYAASGPHRKTLKKTRFDVSRGIAGRVMRSGESEVVNEAKQDPDHYDRVDAETGLQTQSIVCVPLKAQGAIIGVLEAVNSSERDGFGDREKQMLMLFANFAGCAIQNARAFEEQRLDCQGFQSAADRSELSLGKSPAMQNVWAVASRAAKVKSTVLLTGESGVGKEVVASYVHQQSPRRDKPFICVNCAAIDENLLNSELFGHEKGAFTGATDRRIGRFEMAHSGTLFLDEITECSPATQARLLRVLQEQAFERIGGNSTIRTDARIIASSNADIPARIQEGAFREDLFHRINVVNIRVPPLRERREDIAELIQHFVGTFSGELNLAPIEFRPDAVQTLERYEWPGNVREAKNFVERVMVLHMTDTVGREDVLGLLPTAATGASPTPAAGSTDVADEPEAEAEADSLWGAQKRMIEEALLAHNWNQSQAARALGISRHHLRYRIKKFGIRKDGDDPSPSE